MSNIIWGFPSPNQTVVTDQPEIQNFNAILVGNGSGISNVIILENTLNINPIFLYTAPGYYTATIGSFNANKMLITISNNVFQSNLTVACSYSGTDLVITLTDSTGISNDYTGNLSLLIQYYP
jgi:hypothetical protein